MTGSNALTYQSSTAAGFFAERGALMLKDFVKAKRSEDDVISQEVKQAREKLAVYQSKIKKQSCL